MGYWRSEREGEGEGESESEASMVILLEEIEYAKTNWTGKKTLTGNSFLKPVRLFG